MSSRAAYVLALAACTACHGRTVPVRDRVLARIPADSQIVLAAAGSALASFRMRAVIDVVRPQWPNRFGCVIDAALAGDHVAVGIDAERDVVVVIASRATPACPSLSRIEDGLWIATLGSGTPVVTGSVLDPGAHARARPYLQTAPIAASIVVPGASVLATLSPDPLEGWLAIDTAELASAFAEQKLRGVVDRLARTDATARFAAAIAISHDGPQVVARLTGPIDADLAIAVRTVAGWYAASSGPGAAGFACPPLAQPIVGCADGTSLSVSSLAAALAPLVQAPVAAIIENERVAWLRLDAPVPTLGLRRGDLLLAVDGQHVTSPAQLGAQLLRARAATSITVQRDTVTATLRLAE